MMDENQLLSQISLLKDIKPRKEWVVSVRARIMGSVSPINWVGQLGQIILFYSRKPAFVTAAFVLLVTLGFTAQIARQNMQKDQLQIAQNRLEAIQKASQEFVWLVENDPQKALQASRQIVQLQKEQSQLEQTLGAKFSTQGSNDLESATKTLIENEINDLDSRTLTNDQLVLLNDAKNAYVKGDYQTALEKIWTITN